FREQGLPLAIRTDNGPPFASRAVAGLSVLSIYWMKLGIIPERIVPGHPEQNGRHERIHRTLKAETACPPAAHRRAQQEAFDRFKFTYNQGRPHEALGRKTQPNATHPRRGPIRHGCRNRTTTGTFWSAEYAPAEDSAGKAGRSLSLRYYEMSLSDSSGSKMTFGWCTSPPFPSPCSTATNFLFTIYLNKIQPRTEMTGRMERGKRNTAFPPSHRPLEISPKTRRDCHIPVPRRLAIQPFY